MSVTVSVCPANAIVCVLGASLGASASGAPPSALAALLALGSGGVEAVLAEGAPLVAGEGGRASGVAGAQAKAQATTREQASAAPNLFMLL
jgi:hypothetical protein